MADPNPACPIMTADCPPENTCRLTICECCVAGCPDGGPNRSRYHYHCTTCDRRWRVDWPQVQPVYDRTGAVIETAGPIVTEVTQ